MHVARLFSFVCTMDFMIQVTQCSVCEPITTKNSLLVFFYPCALHINYKIFVAHASTSDFRTINLQTSIVMFIIGVVVRVEEMDVPELRMKMSGL